MITRMTRELDSADVSVAERAAKRQYTRDFWPGLLGYLLVMAAVVRWGRLDGHAATRYLWAVTPLIPALWMMRAVAKSVTRADEYQRLLQFRSLAVGFTAAMAASLTVGFLGVAGLALPAAGWIIYSAGMLGWAVTGIALRNA